MLSEPRLGDVLDDYCVKCKRLTNHSLVALVGDQIAKVRCRTCYHDHEYLHEQAPPSKKDLKKAELFQQVLNGIPGATPDAAVEAEVLPEQAAAVAVPAEPVTVPAVVTVPDIVTVPDVEAKPKRGRAKAT